MPFLAGRRRALGVIVALATVTSMGATSAEAVELASAADGWLELRDGAQLVARVKPETPPLRRGTAKVREWTVEGHRVAEVRVPVRDAANEEVWIGDLGTRPASVIWSGLAGARDRDGEATLAVEVTEDGIVEYQTASQVTRCDGAPARLFPRAWDFSARRFRPIVAAVPDGTGQRLVARRGDPAMPAGPPRRAFRWTAASTTTAATDDARSLAAPTALDDDDPATSWAEGLGGDGRGEFLTARSPVGELAVRGLRFIPGDASSEAAFRAKNRIKRLLVAFGPTGDRRFEIELPEDPAVKPGRARQPYWVAFPAPVVAACVTVVLTEVIRGAGAAPPRNFGTTALSELAIFTDLDDARGGERLVADLARGTGCEARIPLLVSLGEAIVPEVVRAVETARGGGRECLIEALVRLVPAPGTPAITNTLVTALANATPREERLLTSALVAAGPEAIVVLGSRLSDDALGVEQRSRAARVLANFGHESATAALLAAAGRGPAAVDDAVVLALRQSSSLAPELLLKAVEEKDPATASAAPADARRATLLRVLPTAAKRDPGRRLEIMNVLRRALASTAPFPVRARAVLALGELGADEAVDELARLRAGSDDPVLRYLATRELAAVGGGAAVVALRAALADQDPRVREAAATGLGHHKDLTSGSALIAAAKQEPWPFVRRAEVDALGRVCVPGAGDLMLRAVERDVDDVRRVALVGLVRCRDPRSKTLLLHTLGRRNEAATLRTLAAALLGELGDPTAAPPMAAMLKRLVVESQADLAAEGVADATLRALGRLGGKDAVATAVTVADDDGHPLRKTAIQALGTLCDPTAGAATLRRLSTAQDPALAAAAQLALRQCSVPRAAP